MPGKAQPLCELWDELPEAAFTHSRLYHLEPIGIGTPFVESLTSYICRLAEAHSIHPRVLITDELLPYLQHSHLYSNGSPTYAHLTMFWKRSAILNGTSTTTSDWVQALEQLTGRSDIRFLTMLAWRQVLSIRELLRRTQAWCPRCYEEWWRKTKQPIYQPLVWTLEAIKICPHHGIRLQTSCPHPGCGAILLPLSPKAHMGYCPQCHRWLGNPSSSPEEDHDTTETEQKWQHWTGGAVGEMLAAAPQLEEEPRQEVFAATIATYTQRILGGNLSRFARQLHIHRRTAWEWEQRLEIPQLDNLLQVCAYLGKTPVRLFLGEPLEATLDHKRAERHLKEKPRRHFRKFKTESIRAELEVILQNKETPPPSMREVGRQLNYDPSHLSKHFSDLCRSISGRYRLYQHAQRMNRLQQVCAQIEQAAQDLCSRGHIPSERQIGKQIKKRGVLREREVRHTLRNIRAAE